MAKNMPENQNGEEEVKEVRISREELKQARREAKAAKKPLPKKKNFRRPTLTIKIRRSRQRPTPMRNPNSASAFPRLSRK